MSPVPIFTELGPRPEFKDVVNKVNTLVQELTNLMLNLDTLNVVELNAEVVIAGTITGDKIAANTITANKMDVSELSAITANLGHITAGLIQAVSIIGSIITGSLIQTTTPGSYPRIALSSDVNSFEALGAVNKLIRILIESTNPSLNFIDGSGSTRLREVGGSFSIESSQQINLSSFTGVTIDGVNVLSAINGKAPLFFGYSGSHGGGTYSNGVLVSVP